MAQWIGSALKGGTVLQRSTSWAICRAAIEMFRHGVNIAGVAVVGSAASPVSPRESGCRREAPSALHEAPPARCDRPAVDVLPTPRTTTDRHPVTPSATKLRWP